MLLRKTMVSDCNMGVSTLQVSSNQIQLAGNPTNCNELVGTSTYFHGGCSKNRSFGSIIRVHTWGVCRRTFCRVCSSIPLEGGQILLHNHLFFVAIHDELCRPIICFFCKETIPSSKCVDVRSHVFGITSIGKSPLIWEQSVQIIWKTLLISEIPPYHIHVGNVKFP